VAAVREPFAQPTPVATNVATVAAAQAGTRTVQVGDSGKVVLTFKGGSGFDAPWIVIHAEDLDDALEHVTTRGNTLIAIMERVQLAGKHFSGLAPAKPAGQPAASAAPAAAQTAPPGAPAAPGPDWEFKTGFAKASGKPWKGWFPPRGADASLKPVFFN
jgi:hypothetical protein